MNRFRWSLALLAGLWLNLGVPFAVVAADVAEEALRATVRVKAGGKSGTGFFVSCPAAIEGGPSHTLLVTAAHAFDETDAERGTLILRAAGGDTGFVRREVEFSLTEGEKKRWVRHPLADIAVIEITLPEGTDIAPLALSRIATEEQVDAKLVRAGMDVLIPCFPGEVEANPAGWPVLRKGGIATHPLTPALKTPRMFVDYAHFGGDSGAPVIATVNGEPLVVGLIFAMLRLTDTTSTRFEERTVHMPLGLGIAAQGPFIRQTIEAWKAK